MSEPVTALLDTTLLSNFAHVRRPDLLFSVLGDAATTPQVMAELRKGEALGFVPTCDWGWLPVWTPTEAEARMATVWARQLDPGEAECLAVAQARGCRFLSDDFAARRLAEGLGLVVSGTLGILLKAVEAGVLALDAADDLLQIMVNRGYRAPIRSLRELAGSMGKRYEEWGLDAAHLPRSPTNAERLRTALARARAGTTKPQTVDELRREVGLSEDDQACRTAAD